MGYYYEQRGPERDGGDRRPGCLETLLIIRVVFEILAIPIAVLVLVFIDIGVTFWLFTLHPALALLTVVPSIGALVWFSQWERSRFRPPGA
ncbi:MAG TPA: hypothetical protein VFC53_11825 [Dehalococcoidia bacterium]|nr:hypothetical protein [Dehalococcoidia bacterium]